MTEYNDIEVKTLFHHRTYKRIGKHIDCYEWSIWTFWTSKYFTYWFVGNKGAIKFMEKIAIKEGLA